MFPPEMQNLVIKRGAIIDLTIKGKNAEGEDFPFPAEWPVAGEVRDYAEATPVRLDLEPVIEDGVIRVKISSQPLPPQEYELGIVVTDTTTDPSLPAPYWTETVKLTVQPALPGVA